MRLEAGLQPSQLQQQIWEAQKELLQLQQHTAAEEATAAKHQQDLHQLQQQHGELQACMKAVVDDDKRLAKQAAAADEKLEAAEAVLAVAAQQREQLGKKFPEEVQMGKEAAKDAWASLIQLAEGSAAGANEGAEGDKGAAYLQASRGTQQQRAGSNADAKIKQLQKKLLGLERKLDNCDQSVVIPAEELVRSARIKP